MAGQAAPLVLPVIRERLARLDRRADRDAAIPLFEAIRSLGDAASESAPELTSLLERRVLLVEVIETLQVLGTAALQAAPALASIAADADMFVRLRAAAAHCAITGDKVLARHTVAALLDNGQRLGRSLRGRVVARLDDHVATVQGAVKALSCRQVDPVLQGAAAEHPDLVPT